MKLTSVPQSYSHVRTFVAESACWNTTTHSLYNMHVMNIPAPLNCCCNRVASRCTFAQFAVIFIVVLRFIQLVWSITYTTENVLPMTTFRCPSDILITSWLFTAGWSTWPGNYPVPCVAELVGSCIPIHALRYLPDPKCLFYPSTH